MEGVKQHRNVHKMESTSYFLLRFDSALFTLEVPVSSAFRFDERQVDAAFVVTRNLLAYSNIHLLGREVLPRKRDSQKRDNRSAHIGRG